MKRLLSIMALAAASCATNPHQGGGETNDKKSHLPEVEVVRIDTVTRQSATNVRVYTDRAAVDTAYSEIAILSVRRGTEQELIDLLVAKAKEIGADAIILIENEKMNVGAVKWRDLSVPVGIRIVKAVAIVYKT